MTAKEAMKHEDFDFIEERIHLLFNECFKQKIDGHFAGFAVLVVAMRCMIDSMNNTDAAQEFFTDAATAAYHASKEARPEPRIMNN